MNLLLDLDGTLTDPRTGIVGCIKYALCSLDQPLPPDEELERYIGPPLQDSFCDLLRTQDVSMISAAVAAYRERFTDIGIYENEVYTGIPEALSLLSTKGVSLWIATSKPQAFAVRIIEHFGLAKYFKGIHGSELDGTRSDKTALIAYILAKEGLRSAETVMVGDRRHDISGAINNQVFPVGVLWGYGSREELSLAGARKLIEFPEELTQFAI